MNHLVTNLSWQRSTKPHTMHYDLCVTIPLFTLKVYLLLIDFQNYFTAVNSTKFPGNRCIHHTFKVFGILMVH